MAAIGTHEPSQASTYAAFAEHHPQAHGLILSLVLELGRQGQCGTLNPAIGYVLRQIGLKTVVVTGELICPDSPIVRKLEAGYHLWVLASDGLAVWHVDAASFFLLDRWHRATLDPDRYDRISMGKEPGPPVPVEPSNFIWGTFASHGIAIAPGSLSAKGRFFDALDKQGKRQAIRDMFRAHRFEDPYELSAGVLNLDGIAPPA